MNQETCSALAALFPILLLTVVVERRGVRESIRRTLRYRVVAVGSAGAATLGILVSVIGVQTDGLDWFWGPALWVVFGVALFGLAVTIWVYIASVSLDEDRNGEKARMTTEGGAK